MQEGATADLLLRVLRTRRRPAFEYRQRRTAILDRAQRPVPDRRLAVLAFQDRVISRPLPRSGRHVDGIAMDRDLRGEELELVEQAGCELLPRDITEQTADG